MPASATCVLQSWRTCCYRSLSPAVRAYCPCGSDIAEVAPASSRCATPRARWGHRKSCILLSALNVPGISLSQFDAFLAFDSRGKSRSCHWGLPWKHGDWVTKNVRSEPLRHKTLRHPICVLLLRCFGSLWVVLCLLPQFVCRTLCERLRVVIHGCGAFVSFSSW